MQLSGVRAHRTLRRLGPGDVSRHPKADTNMSGVSETKDFGFTQGRLPHITRRAFLLKAHPASPSNSGPRPLFRRFS